MVAADLALLSFAVLSTIAFQPVRGDGRYARYRQRIANRDESETVTYATLQQGDSVTSIPVLTSTPTRPSRPTPKTQSTNAAGDAPGTTAAPVDLGHATSSQESASSSSDSSSSISSSSSLSGPDPESSSSEDSTSLTLNTLQLDTESVTSTATAAPTIKVPTRPGKTTATGGGASLIAPTIQLGGGGGQTDNTFVSIVSETQPYNTLQGGTELVTSTRSFGSTTKPGIPGRSSSTLDPGNDAGSTEVVDSDSSTSTIGVKATYSTSDASSSSSSISYIDPEQYGASGTLTTDSIAPSRTIDPSRSSVIPNPTSRIGPPPGDTFVPNPPVVSTTVSEASTAPSTDVNEDPTTVPSDVLSYIPPIATTDTTKSILNTPTNGRPTRISTHISPQTTAPTLDLSHTPPPSSESTTYPVTVPGQDPSDPDYSSNPPPWPTANGTTNSTLENSSYSIITSDVLPPLSQWSYTLSESLTTDDRGSVGTICAPSTADKPTTTYSVIYTSTVTWYGNPTDYTPPYPTLSTPKACIPPKDPLRFTASYCTATRTASGADTSKYATCVTQELTYSPAMPSYGGAPTITFVTTDKNPTVVYSTIETPDYGVSQPATRDQVEHASATPSPDPRVSTPEFQSQVTAGSGSGGNGGSGNGGSNPGNGGGGDGGSGGNGNGGGNGGSPSPTAVNGAAGAGSGSGSGNGNGANSGTGATANNPGHAPAQTPITVGVQPGAVVVNGNTVTDNPTSPTQVITVGGQAVTINPTQVVVAGETVTRPGTGAGAKAGGGGSGSGGVVFIPMPTTTQIQGVPVTVSSSIAVIGGTSFTLGTTPITTVAAGQPVTLGPSGVVVAGTTIRVTSTNAASAGPSATQVVVEGGELITAIGPSIIVIHGTTLTYGPAAGNNPPTTTTVIDDDTITIGPSAVVVHGTTLGGPGAGSSETQYEIVGGATITQIGQSVIVINNATYTVGPGTGTTTTVIGGETVTIGPSGVAAGTHTMSFPFGPTSTTVITPKATGVVATASPTASKDAAVGMRGPEGWTAALVCLFVGVVGVAV